MKILVINCGSSSIKYKLYDMDGERELASGLIERIGESQSQITHRVNGHTFTQAGKIDTYELGVSSIIELLGSLGDPPPLTHPEEIDGVGHRVVHGAEDFGDSIVVDHAVMSTIEGCIELAPLHNPANLAGLKAAQSILPSKPQVAVFDTAFFQTLQPEAYLYAVPYEWYSEKRIRRYGFHGTSHRYVADLASQLLNQPKPNLITLHMGNGCSISCIKEGIAIDQSMGLTPLEGLVMGTRSGDLDPAIIFHMVNSGMPMQEVRKSLEKASGLLGLSGVSRDLRDVQQAAENGNERAELAMGVFAHRAKKYVGAYLAELGRCDAIVFTGGIGENAAFMRQRILSGLESLGIQLDERENDQRCSLPTRISTQKSPIQIFVIPTNEELMIARDTASLVS